MGKLNYLNDKKTNENVIEKRTSNFNHNYCSQIYFESVKLVKKMKNTQQTPSMRGAGGVLF